MTVEPRTRPRTARTRPPAAPAQDAPAVTLGQIFEQLFGPDTPIRFEGYDGSRAGSADATMTIRMVRPRAVSYLITAPGSLGLARAYLQGDLEIDAQQLERVVAADEGNHAAVFAHDAFEKQFRLATKTLPQLVVPVGIEHAVR